MPPCARELPGAAVRAGGRPWLRCLELGDNQTATGGWRARPLPSLPGGPGAQRGESTDKGSGALSQPVAAFGHSCSRACSPKLQHSPKRQLLVSPLWSPRGADTPRLRSGCDTAYVKWHGFPALPEPCQPHRAKQLQGNSHILLPPSPSCCWRDQQQTRG